MKTSGVERAHRARLKALREEALRRHVLARHLDAGFNGRWTRRDWTHASLLATLAVLVMTIVPGLNNALHSTHQTSQTMQALALPLPLSQLHGQAGDSWQMVRIEHGQTLGKVFEQLGVSATTLQQVLAQPGVRKDLSKLKPGTEIAFDLPVNAGLRTLRYDRDDRHRIELSVDGDQIQQKVIVRPTETRAVVVSGEIAGSLYGAGRKAGLSPKAINTLTDQIFKYDIDFDDDVKRGDRFSVVYDETWREGVRIGTGDVLAASFTTRGKTHTGFRYVRNGKAEYFDGNGRPLKKTFIRMPISYARLSSRFGMRKHPVLGIRRQHKGVDYAARTGTPIMAAGDARVKLVGRHGGYGNAVILDHGRGHTTLYGHMSRFGKIRQGQRVAQGTVIGYVGSTGLASGPHLHYEFRINGVHRNPLSITMPPAEPLRGAELVRFRLQTGAALARIRSVESVIYADASPATRKGSKKA